MRGSEKVRRWRSKEVGNVGRSGEVRRCGEAGGGEEMWGGGER